MKFIRVANFAVSSGSVVSAVALSLFSSACATEPATDNTSSFELSGPSTLDPPIAQNPRSPRSVVRPALTPGAKQVGYYDMTAEIGLSYQTSAITAGGGSPVTIDDPSAAELTKLNVFWVNNPDNLSYDSKYVNRLTDIASAVQKGMILVIHDREVTDAAKILPNGGTFSFVRDTEANIDIRDASTVVTTGLDNTSLDGGNFSDHGFAVDTSLPAKAKLILSTGTPSQIVTFCYAVGQGAVIYSSIPLDFYMQGQGPNPPQANLANIYAPNVVKYALAGACAQKGGPQPTPNVTHL